MNVFMDTMMQNIASAVSGLMASGLLQLRGVGGLEGWKWLFIVDGIITVFVAVATWYMIMIRRSLKAAAQTLVASCYRFYLPRNVARTKGGLRGFKPWFTDRQAQIAVTRVVRDDPAKRLYE